MEVDQKVDQMEMKEFEEELMSDEFDEDEDKELADIYRRNAEYLVDSPYPSDNESDDDEEFVVTDSIQARLYFRF